ncbi:MAG TPA: demethoxyubiquinone hydroxylase family protein [Stellaceae bacterium]|jgi:3-demethoxyubiquinol 3-hydroxylase|nr:demethoxyubiquinone hydroxylase family protein [Stellaceae bacterium]
MRRRQHNKATARKTGRLPGDRASADAIARMIRVDQAGEYGAARIYDGQLAVLKDSTAASAVRRMAAQERRHLERFDTLVAERRVRPTALSPLWHIAGYALGAATAMLGEHAAMACTVAVEEVIDEHYRGQLEALGDADAGLAALVTDFRADELEHRDTALKHGATETPGYPLLSAAIKAGSRLAIWLSTRI